jgi:hypothetical protein
MFEEIRYRLRGLVWLSRELLSQLGARLTTRLEELEERGRAETHRWYRVSQKQRHADRVQRWASIQNPHALWESDPKENQEHQ